MASVPGQRFVFRRGVAAASLPLRRPVLPHSRTTTMRAMNRQSIVWPCFYLLVQLLGASASGAESISPDRWRERISDSPWEFSRLGDDAELVRAKAAGFTAMVLANTKWLALPGRAGAEYSARLKGLGDEAATVDRAVRREGAASVRFDEPGARDPQGRARLVQEVTLIPFRQYRISAWIKSE